MKKQYILVLSFGYAEDQALGVIPFTSKRRFASFKEAVVDLAAFFRSHYEGEPAETKKCCTATLQKDADAHYCSRCRTSLRKEEFNPDQFEDWLSRISGTTVDSYSADFVPYSSDPDWDVCDFEKACAPKANTRFVYQAEKVLCAAIGHSVHPDITLDTIFKARSGKSVSFW